MDLFAADSGVNGWIGGVIVAFFGVVTAWLTTRRGEKSDKIQQEQAEVASLIKGYTDQIAAYTGIVTGLQAEVSRLREQYEADRAIWDADRHAWKAERQAAEEERSNLLLKVGKLEAELADLKKG